MTDAPVRPLVMVTGDHPLAMVTSDEITRAVEIIRGTGRLTDEARFAHVVLHEPTKAAIASWKPGDPVDRELRALVVPGPELLMIEVIVSVTAGEIRDWREIEGMRPALLFLEAMNAIFTTKEHPDYIAALARRGITDLDTVQIDPWPAGSFGFDAETDRRIARCISFVRETPDDNGYARPILPGRPRTAAHRPQADRDHPTRRPELHRRRQPRPLGSVVAAHGLRPA